MYIKRFQEIVKEDISMAGGKGANLGEMTAADIRVPDGYVITSDAYRCYMKENQLFDRISETLKEIKGEEKALLFAAKEIREQILKGSMPEAVKAEIIAAYHSLGEKERVAVRSSATAEDLPDASFAGQQETYLNVREDRLIEKVRECYASLWADRAVLYREKHGYDSSEVALAVVVQKMVESEKAGVLFTVNPANQNYDEMQINASYGLGESVVSGRVTPDEYICDRDGRIKKASKMYQSCIM